MNSKILLGIGVAIVIIAMFLPWASVSVGDISKTVTGIAGRGKYGGSPGYLTAILAVLSAGLGMVPKKWAQIVSMLFAALIFGWMFVVYGKDSKCAGSICATIGIGHYLNYVGALVLIAGGVMGFKAAGQPTE